MAFLGIACLSVVLAGGEVRASDGSADSPRPPVDFQLEVRPLLATRCFICHGFDEGDRKGGLRLDSMQGSRALLPSGAFAVVPGDPDGSELLRRVSALDPAERMPPDGHGAALDPKDVQLLRRWIEEGGGYARHWSFERVERPVPPLGTSPEASWCANAVDRFVLERMTEVGFEPSPRASRAVEARRVSLDLIGLPPTPEQVQEYMNDGRAGAYERLVDRLLASPSYGERWARVWLDLARYADSSGYTSDPLRLKIWRYRDWVIDAYNQNIPFDQFTREQMAGDLLPYASKEQQLEQQLATAFHRNTMNNTEGGTDDEEFRMAAVKDRMTTSMQVWMGLTAGCAECHSHKFDPLTHTEYYGLVAIFNQTADEDTNNLNPLRFKDVEQATRHAELTLEIEALTAEIQSPDSERSQARAAWESEVLSGDPSWKVGTLLSAGGREGTVLEAGEDSVIRATGPTPAKDTFELEVQLPAGTWRGLRLEARAEAGRGPGRNGHGNFVLNELRLEGPEADTVTGRHLRLELRGPGRILSLAEVEVFCGGENVAKRGTASQSSTGHGGEAARAIDGNGNGHYFEGNSVTHTATEADPWWELNLGAETSIDEVVVHHRTDNAQFGRSNGLILSIRDDAGVLCWQQMLGKLADGQPSPMGPREQRGRIALASPSADWSQVDFSVLESVDHNSAADSGWAVAPRVWQSHVAVFPFLAPLVLREPASVRIEMEQTYGSEHTLGAFRLSFSEYEGALLPLGSALLEALQAQEPSQAQEELLAGTWLDHLKATLRARKEERNSHIPSGPPVLQARPEADRRPNSVLQGGNFLTPLGKVQAGVPAAFHPLPEGFEADRLGFAEWLSSRDNPLTARVAVNRIWAQLFGRGLVVSEENLGSQGDMPTHRTLLDWLAAEYMDSGWDQKALLRTLVTSATYRQASVLDERARDLDPTNRFLARGPSFRLEAEMIRDQALKVSGLLSPKMHGPSVYPHQPPGLWKAAFNGQRTWPSSQGEDRHRRGLYTFLRRSMPYPAMQIFDAPSREMCTSRRLRTNTPLQAFVTLNDPAFVETAQALGRRMHAEGGGDARAGVRRGLWLVLQRPPEDADVGELVRLFEDALGTWEGRAAEALALATDPLGPLPEGLNAERAAAWTAVANVLLNLDAVLVKD
ncbi:MAG TPA: DUF1553 domain-containing protein [Planctomycetes bacterium]|nr:DUF1553 domain-containing protein [Planctomycetota bacterium]